ncbi:LLM class flavin-dependent oxidoreductase [Ralstonia syzygii]|uniref:Putative alkanal monooxygenase (FMN-linked),bacterial luciferase-like n=1 Tax=Ralstonia syzygii R24 TaxID=907261 RepID=G3AAT7_9RALS|nr:LLM class flavin-dependent oxidoreductase [Ralstonia syzygii]CCA86838.1 putative alkanal monooxygenase (FMN-linked),bacterial luciferase-like [Ralstonia syzygii R24]
MIKSWIFEQVNVSTCADAGMFDAVAFQHELGWRLNTWTDAEALGFHGIFFSEHHFSGVRVSPSPAVLAAAVAARTTVLRIGVLGWVLPLWQPWRFLEYVGMLDHLSQGRLEIGVARGSSPQEAEAVGVAAEDVSPMFDEALDILDKAWAEPTLSHQGRYWSFDRLPVLPRPLQQPRPPVWGTVRSAASAREVAARGYGACTGFLPTSQVKVLFDSYRDAVSARDARDCAGKLALRRCVFVADSASEALEQAASAREKMPSILAEDTIAGTPRSVTEEIVHQMRETGAGNIIGFFAGNHDDRDAIQASYRLFGAQVIPVLSRTPL